MSNNITKLNDIEKAKQQAFEQPGGIFLTPDLRLMFHHGENAFGFHMTPEEAIDLAGALVHGVKAYTKAQGTPN